MVEKAVEQLPSYWLPMIHYSAADMVNRHAAATGSVDYAMLTSSADYNGHYITISFKPKAVNGPTWNTEYWWGGRVVLARGKFLRCVEAGAAYYRKDHLGSVVVAHLSDEAPETLGEQAQFLRTHNFVPHSREIEKAHYDAMLTPAHKRVRDAFGYQRWYPSLVTEALRFEGTWEEWEKFKLDYLAGKRS